MANMTFGSHENHAALTVHLDGCLQQIQLQPQRNLASASCKDNGDEGIITHGYS